MKLIKVVTKGFKSFADKVVLNFDGGVVGIVGPNGSGKSNINDAIKWVLGEQSLKNLRGDSNDDIIFSGSKKVKSMNKAEVFLTFDNSDGKCSLPHKKIVISRHIERGVSKNKYFINGEVAKLKEIKEIAMESGIGKSSLAIISQGTIQNIAQASPEERRGFFEEAAGISKYKQRKKEAMSKLEKTTEALDKILIIVKELEKQLNSLKKQAEKAKLYLSKKTELKEIELGLIANDILYFGQELEKLNDTLKEMFSYKEELKEKISNYEEQFYDKNSKKLLFENEIISLNNDLQVISEKLRDLEILNSQASQRRQLIIEGKVNSSSKLKIKAMNEELQELSKKITHYKNSEKKSLEEITNKKESALIKQNKINELIYSIDKNQKKLIQFSAKVDILRNQKNNKTFLFRGSKAIIDNSSFFKGFIGLVMDLIKVEEEYKISIETILSNVFQHIVVENSIDAVRCVQFLNKNKAGRATFIPLNTIKPKFIQPELLSIIEFQNGYVGIAKDLIMTQDKFNILKKFLLGNIIIVDNIENANSISKLINNSLMVVTLNGDVIRAGGVISGGEKSNTTNLLGMNKEIQKLEEFIPHLKEKIQQEKLENQILFNSISEDRSFISVLNIETAKIIEKRNISQIQFNNLKSQYESETNKEFVADNIEIISTENIEMKKSLIQTKLKLKRDSIVDLNKEISQLNILKTENEKTLRNLIESSTTKINEKNQAEFIINNQKERLISEYEITIENVISKYSLKINKEEARKIVSRLRKEIKEIGHINLDAIEKYQEIKKRHIKLYNSEQELMGAKDTIINAIHNMDEIIVKKLDGTVKNVNAEMTNIFKTMFGGGMAEIRYTNPNNILTTGIEVIAQPPGKTVKNLKLFSGGEKAIVAITVLFAILKSKPIPLCILDEVEAALDDANVLRYASYLQKLKKQTQFIVVTHRVGTMSKVDHLFGATMQTRGVTSFFTVKLSDAKKMIE